MREYADFPPYGLLIIALKQSPEAAHLFVDLWKFKNFENLEHIEKSKIRECFLMSPTMFRNKLMQLTECDLLTFKENGDHFVVALVDDE